nr:mitochondrial-processing peptidase subunit alpha-like [Lepeophtheirus salmonis]
MYYVLEVFCRSTMLTIGRTGTLNLLKHGIRQCSGITNVPLDKSIPGLWGGYQNVTKTNNETTKVTTLSNGLRVATEPVFGGFCTVGVCVDSGSRYEVAHPSGISHFLEKMAFGATLKYKNRQEILHALEKHGGICDCQATRDIFLYATSIDHRGLECAIDIIAETVLRPKIEEEEIELTRNIINYELQDLALKPEQEPLLLEMIHAVAFKGNTVGLPRHCPQENIGSIKRETILNYLGTYHTPDRIVLAGVGVDHDELVEYGQKYFVDTPPSYNINSSSNIDRSVSQYTGGISLEEKDLSNVSLGPTPMPELAHLVIGLEGVSHQDPDFIPYCVLNSLMGGGGSFSAGGPGKGMYTRLYTHVLNVHHWMYSCQSANHAYADGGIFCITSSAPPYYLAELAQVVIREFAILTGDIGDQEFNRAKKQLSSMLFMNVESKPVIFEDLARQVLAQGKRKTTEEFHQLINDVTKDDLRRIARRMLTSKPSVAAVGEMKYLPSYKDIELALLDKKGSLPTHKAFSLFR